MKQRSPRVIAIAAIASLPILFIGNSALHAVAAQLPAAQAPTSPAELTVTVGKSVLVNSAPPIERVSIGFGEVAEATAVSPNEVLLNGKAPGETTLIIWQRGGSKLMFNVFVTPSQFLANTRVEAVRNEIAQELPGQNINLSFEGDLIFLRGTAKDLTSAERAVGIASTMGKPVNLLYVNVPAPEAQILLKVRFASVDRSASQELGVNIFSTGATNTIGSLSTQQFPAPSVAQGSNGGTPFSLSDALNLFFFRPDLQLGATIKALETKGLLQVLAEPNVLAQNGKSASFLAGGEYPFPIVQGGGAGGVGGAVTIQFKEFGVRLNFIPTITPRKTIQLQVAPEVSSLDFSNGLVVQGFQVPALTVRKVETSIELADGQSFAIGGLLDNRETENFQKVPFIGSIPILGNLFKSKSVQKQNTELIVIVTPELVRPIPAGAPLPQLNYPKPFLLPNSAEGATRTPGIKVTGPVPVTPPTPTIPVEELIESLRPEAPLVMNGAGPKARNSDPTREMPAQAPLATAPPMPTAQSKQ